MVRPYESGREFVLGSDSQKPQKLIMQKEGQRLKMFLFIGFLVAVLVVAWVYRAEISSSYSIIKNSTKDSFKPLMQIFNPDETMKQYQDIWGSPTVKETEKKVLGIEWVNAVSKIPLSVLAKLNVNTNADITLKMQCSLDNADIETEPQEISFKKSELEQHSSIKCSNDVGGKELKIKIEKPIKVKSVLTIWIGSGESQGIPKSEMDKSSDYSFLLTTADDVPFATGSYPMIVKIKKDNQNAILKRINSLKVSTLSDKIMITCPAISGDREALSKYLTDRAADTYIIECGIEVIGNEDLQRAFIEAELDYVVEEEFKTPLSQ